MRIVNVISDSELKELKRKQHLAKIYLIASEFDHRKMFNTINLNNFSTISFLSVNKFEI